VFPKKSRNKLSPAPSKCRGGSPAISGLYIKKEGKVRYPEPLIRRYKTGDVRLPKEPEQLLFISFFIKSEAGRDGFADLSLDLWKGKTLRISLTHHHARCVEHRHRC
jgi:hypothetical protein